MVNLFDYCKKDVTRNKKTLLLLVRLDVIATGFEPVTVCLEGRCSIQLSYATIIVGVAGFEPAASTSQTWRDNRATLHPELVILNLRRDGDSNPGYPVRVRLFSKQVLSATQAPLQKYVYKPIFASANVTLEMHLHNLFLLFLKIFYTILFWVFNS